MTGVEEGYRAGAGLREIFVEERVSFEPPSPAGSPGLPVRVVSGEVMRKITATKTPQGIVAVSDFCDADPGKLLQRDLSLSVVLAEVRDPGNAGTILRTAAAAGADAVFVGEGSVDVYNPKVVRAAAGAIFNVPFARDVDVAWLLERFGEEGATRIAADPQSPRHYDEVEMRGRIALVFGNEAWGVPEELARLVDVRASIPMEGSTESLNVAIAAALFLFEARRQRR